MEVILRVATTEHSSVGGAGVRQSPRFRQRQRIRKPRRNGVVAVVGGTRGVGPDVARSQQRNTEEIGGNVKQGRRLIQNRSHKL